MTTSLTPLLAEIRQCRACAEHLPLGPRPVVLMRPEARLLIIGQAPGTRVHKSGQPWDDPSGDRLRDWLQMDRAQFYEDPRIAIMPMGFCYPGRGRSGDLPPRPECAPLWHGPLLRALPSVRLILLIGNYAQRYYLPDWRRQSLTERVKRWQDCPAPYFPLVHPSPRNRLWLRRQPWFEAEVVPALRQKVADCL